MEISRKSLQGQVEKQGTTEEDDGSLPDDILLGHQELHFPDISETAQYLVSLFHSSGMASATGMGLVGLSYQEIESWARLSGLYGILSPWQYNAIHTMSRAYAGMYANASQKGAKPPYMPPKEDIEDVKELVSKQAENVFESMLFAQDNR